ELRGQIEKMIHEAGLDNNFLITGWVDNPAAYMKIMNIGTLLSRWEGFGLVLPEYMACGVPIVATNVDAIPNIVQDGKNGILVNQDDDKAILEAVKRANGIEKQIVALEKKFIDKYSGVRLNMYIYSLYNDLLG